MSREELPSWHGTTILSVRKNGAVVVAGDGQVSFGNTVMKSTAKKVRRLGRGDVIAGFAGATADALALFERLEAKLEQHPGQLARACVELAKDWRTDRYLRRLEAMMAVADKQVSLVLTGTGDVLEPENGVMGIGSGGNYALAAAREGQRALAASGGIRVRMGLHTGEPQLTEGGYVGIDVHRAARVADAGHGGQILLTEATRALLDDDGLRDLGIHRLKDVERSASIRTATRRSRSSGRTEAATSPTRSILS